MTGSCFLNPSGAPGQSNYFGDERLKLSRWLAAGNKQNKARVDKFALNASLRFGTVHVGERWDAYITCY